MSAIGAKRTFVNPYLGRRERARRPSNLRVKPPTVSQVGPKGRHKLPAGPPLEPFALGPAELLWNTRRRFDPSSSPSARSLNAVYSPGQFAGK
jgi:hypothetical protein